RILKPSHATATSVMSRMASSREREAAAEQKRERAALGGGRPSRFGAQHAPMGIAGDRPRVRAVLAIGLGRPLVTQGSLPRRQPRSDGARPTLSCDDTGSERVAPDGVV